jgi:LysM repeat protein
MTAGHSDRRLVKIRRRGRHSTPSQVEKVAAQAGKAAPAVAIAGALVAVPSAQSAFAATDAPATVATQAHEAAQAREATHAAQQGAEHKAALDSVSARAVTVASASTARHRSSHYTVRSGDTLSTIAKRFYDNASGWGYIYHENAGEISNPNMIYVGERLDIPGSLPAHYQLSEYLPKHAAPVKKATVTAKTTHHHHHHHHHKSGGHSGGVPSGNLGCSGLEQLWDDAGGNRADAFMAAEIAMAESGGRQYALSPTDDYGYWQINASNGSLATFNAYENARSAIIISDDGTNWNPWTTYREGLYEGRC